MMNRLFQTHAKMVLLAALGMVTSLLLLSQTAIAGIDGGGALSGLDTQERQAKSKYEAHAVVSGIACPGCRAHIPDVGILDHTAASPASTSGTKSIQDGTSDTSKGR